MRASTVEEIDLCLRGISNILKGKINHNDRHKALKKADDYLDKRLELTNGVREGKRAIRCTSYAQ